MGTQTLTGSVTLVPSGYTGLSNLTVDGTYGVDRGYTDASSTTYARFNLSTSTTGYLYYKFDTSDIPPNATITSITARGKARVNNTTRVTNTVMQLYSGTTSKGSNTTFSATTASTQNLSVGSGWTRSDLNDLRLRVGATGSSSTSTKRFDFYGADVTIAYSYTVTTYDITVTNSSSATVTASANSVIAGESVEINTNTLTGITITDNNTDVTNQFTQVTGGTASMIPYDSTVTNFTVTDLSNAYAGSDSTNYARFDAAGGATTGTVYLDLGGVSIPSGASIQSVSCSATLEYNRNNSSSGASGSCQLYTGTTAKGSSQSIITSGGTSVAKTTYNLTVGSWTAAELANAKFMMTMTNNASSTHRYMYIYGVTLTVTYTISGTLYVYTISNVSANHTIVVTSSGSQDVMYVRVNGSWVAATAVYKRVNGSWVQQTDLTNVFDSGTNYKVT